ncbi:GTP cyclohydrolase II [Pediococcus siamensis]|uniref:GTP cyclohydrolase II n=1 Tax=Pediococcus siamensis TaxID=381829 RepID=UPI0039A0937F
MKSNSTIIKVENALQTLQEGRLVIVTDSKDREAEGDMVGLAQYATPETVNQMIRKARGLLCVPMTQAIATRLHLSKMTGDETEPFGTAFTLSADAKSTTTGISAFDRAATIKQLADVTKTADDFFHPGHVFPLVAKAHGVLQRGGHTEAAVDLAKLAHAVPVAYICEILKKDGHMARSRELKAFAEGMQMPLITIQDIKQYRYIKNIDVLNPIPKIKLPSTFGNFNLEAFETPITKEPALLISKGNLNSHQPLLLRIHSECLTGDVFGSTRCDCGEQLHAALRKIEANGSGALIYLRQEGRGIGLINKLKAYKLQENGFDTVDANLHLGFEPDQRDYGIVASILKTMGVQQVKLMTNNPNKMNQLKALGIDIITRIPLEIPATKEDQKYLETKKHKLNHLLKGVQ